MQRDHGRTREERSVFFTQSAYGEKRESQRYSFCGADVSASSAQDAFGAAYLAYRIQRHGAHTAALTAADAGRRVDLHTGGADSAEKRVECSEGTQIAAEKALYEYRAGDHSSQQQDLPPEKRSCHLPESAVGKRQGDPTLQGSRGADVFAEPRDGASEVIAEECRKYDHEQCQKGIFQVSQKPVRLFGDSDPFAGDLSQKILYETERAQVSRPSTAPKSIRVPRT